MFAASKNEGIVRPAAGKKGREEESLTQSTLEDSSPLPFLLIMTLECGEMSSSLAMREHSGMFREFPA
jgi:hypothetical protein